MLVNVAAAIVRLCVSSAVMVAVEASVSVRLSVTDSVNTRLSEAVYSISKLYDCCVSKSKAAFEVTLPEVLIVNLSKSALAAAIEKVPLFLSRDANCCISVEERTETDPAS